MTERDRRDDVVQAARWLKKMRRADETGTTNEWGMALGLLWLSLSDLDGDKEEDDPVKLDAQAIIEEMLQRAGYTPEQIDQEALARLKPEQKDSGRVYEQMVRVRVGIYIVRGWLHADEKDSFDDLRSRAAQFEKLVNEALARAGPPWHVVEAIAKLCDFVNAVEVLGPDGNGVLLYPTWP